MGSIFTWWKGKHQINLVNHADLIIYVRYVIIHLFIVYVTCRSILSGDNIGFN